MTSRVQARLLLSCVFWWLFSLPVVAQQEGGYLSYQEPQTAGPSILSTVAYAITVLLTIGLVVGLAYFTSRLLGEKFTRRAASGPINLLASLVLGPNRGIYVVDIAGKVLVVGVTDHNINLLQEITQSDAIAVLRNEKMPETGDFAALFQRQLAALRQTAQKLTASAPRQCGANDINHQEKR